jgi:AraC-like DNA-binding protein
MDPVAFLDPVLAFHVYVKDAPHFQKTHDTYVHWALFIVEEGGFDYRLGHLVGKAVKDDLILVPPGLTFHRSTSGLSFHFIGFDWSDQDGSAGLAMVHVPPTGKVRLSNNARFRSSLAQLRDAGHMRSGLGRAYKSHLLRDMMYLLQLEGMESRLTRLYSEEPLLQQALRLIEQQAELGVPLKSVAAELGIAQVRLTRLFQREFGISPGAYATRLRMDKVKQLLGHTSLTLAQIADGCGFADEHHLSKSFKKATGINPSDYRKAYSV